MPKLDEAGLKEKLRSEPVGVYLLYGEENYLKKIYSEKIVSKCVGSGFAEFNLHVFDGKETTLSEIYDSAQAVPLMAESTCVLVNDLPFDSFSDDDFDRLETVISENPETCALVFNMLTSNPSGAKWNKAVKLFELRAFAVKFERKGTADLIRLLESGAKKRGSEFDRNAVPYLIGCVGSDLNTLLNETEKLSAYAKGRAITKADIDELCPKSLEATAFEMTKALLQGRFDFAFAKLDSLFTQKEDANKILGALVASYADLYRAKAAVTAGKRAQEIAQYYNYANKEFRLTNAARDCAALSLDMLAQCIDALAQADMRLKNFGGDERLILEQTLVKLALIEGNKRK